MEMLRLLKRLWSTVTKPNMKKKKRLPLPARKTPIPEPKIAETKSLIEEPSKPVSLDAFMPKGSGKFSKTLRNISGHKTLNSPLDIVITDADGAVVFKLVKASGCSLTFSAEPEHNPFVSHFDPETGKLDVEDIGKESDVANRPVITGTFGYCSSIPHQVAVTAAMDKTFKHMKRNVMGELKKLGPDAVEGFLDLLNE